ncbi:MAG: hypothetical protein LBV34_19795 [Nocardiopsaceae bacterium]|jgi:hypothetical protein|nr:hypothetical protein [Nocardiopsaceae bacterium]
MGLSSAPAAPDRLRALTVVETVLRYFVTTVCAASAGVHAALIGPHLEEGLPIGAGFAVATVALALTAVAVRQPRHDPWAPAVATAALCLIAIGYVLSRSTGLPLLIGHAEELDPLGIATTTAEIVGAAASAALTLPRKDRA